MKIGIISTGDELLRGDLIDTNSAWLAGRLFELGHKATELITVGDDLEALRREFTRAFAAFDLVVVTGGLGPTDDDLTAQAVAGALSLPLEHSEAGAEVTRTAFARIGREMNPINLKQALLPKGVRVLSNPVGTAPGFELNTPAGTACFFPGVPREFKPMCEEHLLTRLATPRPRHRAVFKCTGRGESDLQAALKEQCSLYDDLHISFRASFPEILVGVEAPGDELLHAGAGQVRSVLGAAVFAEENISLPEALGRALMERGLTVATAESCTGGLIGHALTEISGSSAYVVGGVIAYDNQVKTDLLGVDTATLEAHGAVSEPVARAMATGVRKRLGASIGLSTSGIAGPTGGTAEKPVGLVHMAVAHSSGVRHKSHVFEGYDRTRVKRAATWTVLRMALDVLMETK